MTTYNDCIVAALHVYCMFRGRQGTELVSRSAVTQYRRQQVHAAQPELLDSKTSHPEGYLYSFMCSLVHSFV